MSTKCTIISCLFKAMQSETIVQMLTGLNVNNSRLSLNKTASCQTECFDSHEQQSYKQDTTRYNGQNMK